MKRYITFGIVIIGLAMGSYFTELQFLSYSHSPASTSAPSTESALSSSTTKASSVEIEGVGTSHTAVKTSRQEAIASTTSTATFKIGETLYTVAISPDETVIDAMRVLSSAGDITFTGRDYPLLGFFVASINDKKNSDGYYWILYVNGKSSDTGASQTRVHPGDIAEWRYEKGY